MGRREREEEDDERERRAQDDKRKTTRRSESQPAGKTTFSTREKNAKNKCRLFASSRSVGEREHPKPHFRKLKRRREKERKRKKEKSKCLRRCFWKSSVKRIF